MSRRRARLSAARIWLRFSLRRRGRVRCLAQQLQGVGGVEILERLQRGGEVLAQRVSQPQRVAGAFPDQRLVRSGNHFDRFGLRAVGRDRPQLVRVGADHVGQGVCIRRVALGAGHAVAFPVPGRLQRIDRIHRVTGRDQRCHPRTRSVSIPTTTSASSASSPRCAPIIACSRADPGHALGQPCLGQRLPGLVHQLDVVMILAPNRHPRTAHDRAERTVWSGGCH